METQQGSIPANRDIKHKYNSILLKLSHTISIYGGTFPQLEKITEFISIPMPDTSSEAAYLARLEELCTFLEILSVGSYIIRHLQHNLRQDVDAVKESNMPSMEALSYLDLPQPSNP